MALEKARQAHEDLGEWVDRSYKIHKVDRHAPYDDRHLLCADRWTSEMIAYSAYDTYLLAKTIVHHEDWYTIPSMCGLEPENPWSPTPYPPPSSPIDE